MSSSGSEDDEQENSRARVITKLIIETTEQFLHILETTAEAEALESATDAVASGIDF